MFSRFSSLIRPRVASAVRAQTGAVLRGLLPWPSFSHNKDCQILFFQAITLHLFLFFSSSLTFFFFPFYFSPRKNAVIFGNCCNRTGPHIEPAVQGLHTTGAAACARPAVSLHSEDEEMLQDAARTWELVLLRHIHSPPPVYPWIKPPSALSYVRCARTRTPTLHAPLF